MAVHKLHRFTRLAKAARVRRGGGIFSILAKRLRVGHALYLVPDSGVME